jgi:hypothetical protein
MTTGNLYEYRPKFPKYDSILGTQPIINIIPCKTAGPNLVNFPPLMLLPINNPVKETNECGEIKRINDYLTTNKVKTINVNARKCLLCYSLFVIYEANARFSKEGQLLIVAKIMFVNYKNRQFTRFVVAKI